MKKIWFGIFKAFNYFISALPYSFVLGISRFLYFLMYYIVGYRKNVVRTNLKNAFPAKDVKELKKIEKIFFQHLCDTLIESITLYKISEKGIRKRCTFSNLEVLDRLYNDGKSVLGVVGHYGNWEYLIGLSLFTKFEVLGLYKPLHNEYFDKFMFDVRSSFGMVPVPLKTTMRTLLNYQKEKIQTFMVIVGDQSPSKEEIQYWTPFLNQDTPIFLGAEKIATKLNQAVVYIRIDKVKRGHYNVSFEELFYDSNKTEKYEISEAHLRKLEEIINERPEYWLWSHKRWKHKRKDFQKQV